MCCMVTYREWISFYADSFVTRSLAIAVLGITKEWLILILDNNIDADVYDILNEYAKRYFEEKEPLAYILWYEIFGWRRFAVSEATLIPRPETEYLVQYVKEDLVSISDDVLQENSDGDSLWWCTMDIWTGSGCVGLSLAMDTMCESSCLVDVSLDALIIAEQNMRQLLAWEKAKRQSLYLVHSDLLKEVPLVNFVDQHWMIVANLPYIPRWYVWVEEDVKKREPWLALYSWDDWLFHYLALIGQLIEMREALSHKYKCVIWMEMMIQQYDELLDKCDDLIDRNLIISSRAESTFHDNIVMVRVELN